MSLDDDDDLDDYTPGHNRHHQQEADKHQAQAEIDAAVTEDLLHNPRYDEFFAAYQPQVREDFTYRYVFLRQEWAKDGKDSERLSQTNLHKQEAYTTLWAVQHKKLFDLQCRWRAEEVSGLPEVLIGDDFDFAANKIENCHLVPPIAPEEFALLLDWVRQADYERDLNNRLDTRFAWHDYRFVKETLAPAAPPAASRVASGNKTLSEWYRFHNQHTGHDRLLYLPDVRGAKEERYLNEWRKEVQEEEAIKRAAGPPPDSRPSHLSQEEQRALAVEFAQRFESPSLNRWRELADLIHPPDPEADRQFGLMVALLRITKEAVPVEAGSDWREATRQAYFAYSKRKLLDYLPEVYEEYQQRQEWGIAHPNRADWDYSRFHISRMVREWILIGRARLGEPQDYDF